MYRLLLLTTLLALSACATPNVNNTPSSKVEITIDGQRREVLKDRISEVMFNKGYTISNDTASQIAFDRPITDHMARLLFSGPNDQLTARVVFSFTQSPIRTRCVVDFLMVASHRTRTVNNGSQAADYQAWLNEIKRALQSK